MVAVSTLIHESDDHGTFSEFLHLHDAPRFAILAPHGGQVEPNTDVESLLVAQHLETASAWGTRGIVNDGYGIAFGRWHTTGKTHPLSVFPLYQQLLDGSYDAACSLHVMQEEGIIIGGRAPEEAREDLREHLQKHFPSEDVRIGRDGLPRSGMNPGNFVNSLETAYPIHIEQSVELATLYPAKLARSIATWFVTFQFDETPVS